MTKHFKAPDAELICDEPEEIPYGKYAPGEGICVNGQLLCCDCKRPVSLQYGFCVHCEDIW